MAGPPARGLQSRRPRSVSAEPATAVRGHGVLCTVPACGGRAYVQRCAGSVSEASPRASRGLAKEEAASADREQYEATSRVGPAVRDGWLITDFIQRSLLQPILSLFLVGAMQDGACAACGANALETVRDAGAVACSACGAVAEEDVLATDPEATGGVPGDRRRRAVRRTTASTGSAARAWPAALTPSWRHMRASSGTTTTSYAADRSAVRAHALRRAAAMPCRTLLSIAAFAARWRLARRGGRPWDRFCY